MAFFLLDQSGNIVTNGSSLFAMTAFGDGTEIASGTLVRGSAYTFDPPSGLSSGTGDYSATNIPLGMSLDAATGQLSGTPVSAQEVRTMVWSRSGASDVNIDLGITPKTGYPVPNISYFNIHIPSVASWDTDVTATSRADLITKMNAAYADTGTASAPKFHRISYTGPHLDASTPEGIAGSLHLNSGASDTYVYVEANHATDPFVRADYLYGTGNTIFANFEIHGLGQSGSYAKNNPTYVSTLAGINQGYYNCRFGYYWRGFLTDQNGDLDISMRTQGGNVRVALEKCEVAGWKRFFSVEGGDIFAIDTYCHHMNEDPFYVTTRTQGGANLYMVGFYAHRYLQKAISSTSEPDHVDGMQTGVSTDSASYDYGSFQIYDYVNVANTGHYGGTGIRLQAEGASGFTTLDMKNAVVSISGVDAIVNAFDDVTINGFLAFPGVSTGTNQLRFDIGSRSSVSISNIMYSGWDVTSHTVGGHEIVVNESASSGAGSFPVELPNLSGSVKSQSYVGNNGANTTFVPDFLDEECNPESLLGKLSASLYRGTGWGDSANIIDDPAGFGVYDWNFSASSKPTLSGLVITPNSAMSVDTDTSGLLWWFISTANDANIDQTHVMFRMESDGTSPSKYAGQDTSRTPAYGRVFVSSPGTVDLSAAWSSLVTGTDYYLYLAMEGDSGRFSDVMKSTAFQKT